MNESEWKNLQIVFATAQREKLEKIVFKIFLRLMQAGKIAMKLDPNDKIMSV